MRIKKYFYVLRPILACEWIERFGTMPAGEANLDERLDALFRSALRDA